MDRSASRLKAVASVALVVALVAGTGAATVAGGPLDGSAAADAGTDAATDAAAPNATASGTETEPNDDRANATRIEGGETVTATVPPDDVDWYALDASAGEVVSSRLELRGGAGDGDGTTFVRLDLYGPDGERLGEVPGDGILGPRRIARLDGGLADSVAEVADVAPENGTYYLRVAPNDAVDDLDAANYTLTANATAQDDPFEPNERPGPGSATPVAPNGTVNGTVAAYDSDWFAVNATAGQQLTLVGDVSTNTRVAASIVGPDGEPLLTQEQGVYTTANRSFEVTAPENGTYYVRIGQSQFNAFLYETYGYDLTIRVEPGEGTADGDDGNGDGDGSGNAPDDADGDDPNGDAPVDTDDDGLTDEEEAELGTDPTDPDTDGDGVSDCREVTVYGTDPTDPDDAP